MSIYTKMKGALLGSLLAVPSVVHAEVATDPNCWRTEEVDAARFEDFRLKLIVGALNCKNYLPGAATSYNNFLAAKKELVLANMYVVRAHFVHEAGTAEGADQFANYETLAGNRYSSPTFDKGKCETIDTYLKLATTLPDAELVKMVAVLSPGPLPSGCKVAARPTPTVVVAAAPPVPAATPAVLLASAAPMTDAQRIAASTAATRQLIASRATLAHAAAPVAPVDVAAVPVAAVVTPVAVATPVAQPVAREESVLPATLLIADAKPAPEVKPVAEVRPVVAQPVPVLAAAPVQPVAVAAPSAAQALADAAKALAAAAAAMQQTATH